MYDLLLASLKDLVGIINFRTIYIPAVEIVTGISPRSFTSPTKSCDRFVILNAIRACSFKLLITGTT